MHFKKGFNFRYLALITASFSLLAFAQVSLAEDLIISEPSSTSYVDLADESLALAFAVGLNRLKRDERCRDYDSLVVVPALGEDGHILTVGGVGEGHICWVSTGYRFSAGKSSPLDSDFELGFELLWISPISIESQKPTAPGSFYPSKNSIFDRLMM